MPDPKTKTCPKCSGAMIQGRIMKYNEYSALNKYLYVFAPDENLNPVSKERKALVAFACNECGFTEFYSQPI